MPIGGLGGGRQSVGGVGGPHEFCSIVRSWVGHAGRDQVGFARVESATHEPGWAHVSQLGRV